MLLVGGGSGEGGGGDDLRFGGGGRDEEFSPLRLLRFGTGAVEGYWSCWGREGLLRSCWRWRDRLKCMYREGVEELMGKYEGRSVWFWGLWLVGFLEENSK